MKENGHLDIMTVNILTLKIGDRYGPEYVNRLYNGIKRNSTIPFNFFCYTEDPTGLDDAIVIIPIENPDKLKLQWHKLEFHKTGFANIDLGASCLILDIDWIIIDNIDKILNHSLDRGQFGCFERWWSNKRNFCKLNGGFQMYRMGDTQHLYDIFFSDPEKWQEYFIQRGEAEGPVNGEQNFIDLHASDNRHWFPMDWFAKYREEEYYKIQQNWHLDVNNTEPYYLAGEFCNSIKMIHFSNSTNLIHTINEEWVQDHWK